MSLFLLKTSNITQRKPLNCGAQDPTGSAATRSCQSAFSPAAHLLQVHRAVTVSEREASKLEPPVFTSAHFFLGLSHFIQTLIRRRHRTACKYNPCWFAIFAIFANQNNIHPTCTCHHPPCFHLDCSLWSWSGKSFSPSCHLPPPQTPPNPHPPQQKQYLSHGAWRLHVVALFFVCCCVFCRHRNCGGKNYRCCRSNDVGNSLFLFQISLSLSPSLSPCTLPTPWPHPLSNLTSPLASFSESL